MLLNNININKRNSNKNKQIETSTTTTTTEATRKKNRQEFVCYRELFGSIQYIFLLFRLYSRFFFYLTRLALQNTKTAK